MQAGVANNQGYKKHTKSHIEGESAVKERSIEIVFIGAWIGCLILGTLIRLRNRPANKKHIQHDYEEPTNSIPHGNFFVTDDGFIYTFYSNLRGLSESSQIMDSTSDNGKIVALFIIYIPFILLSTFIYLYRSVCPTKICVDK
jgi:hypothetical protein